jgi:hypothetical protein
MTQNTFSTANSAALASNIEKFEISSNYDKTLDVSVGTVQVQYFESILDYTVRVSATIIDTGHRTDGAGANVFEDEDLKLTGGEKVHLILADNFDQKLDFSQFRIKKIRDIVEHTQQVVYTLDLWSQECEDNELVKCRVTKRYDGKVSDSVRKILTEVLKTKKIVDVDTTANEFPFLGRLEKPFYKCTWLAKRCIPQLNGTKGKTAGYFFFETADGYKFKSIDNLWAQTPKRRLIYTNTPSLPDEYDAKILEYYFDNTIDVEQSMSTGAMFKSELQATNFYDNKPRRNELSHEQQQNSSSMGGLEHPKLGADRNLQNEATRITVKFDKKGVLPPGKTLKNQLEKSKENDYNIDEITRQAYMRYNQLFTYKLSLTIPGDFGLRAGDVVYCDFPEISSKNMKLVSQKKSGLYMIVDLSHLITTNKTFTKLNLVRDSIGRKPF